MKLFLSSIAISDKQAPDFINLVGKAPQDIKLTLIENAADGENGTKEWVVNNRQAIQSHGFTVDILNLDVYRSDQAGLEKRLTSSDVIWFGGGNTFYLRWLLRDIGADNLITELVHRGTVYGGGSAGAIIAGPTLRYFDAADNCQAAPEVYWDGLGLTNTVVVPHVDNPAFAPIVCDIENKLKDAGYLTASLTDNQALIINDCIQKIV